VAGLFGLFGKKKDDEAPQPEAKPQQARGAYYLDSDEARTYGDLNYMRTSKKVRRTFPKTVNNEEMELEKEISSMNASKPNLGTQVPKVSIGSVVSSNPTTSTSSSANSSTNGAAPKDVEVSQRRKADSSLDMFRNMAKDIRK